MPEFVIDIYWENYLSHRCEVERMLERFKTMGATIKETQPYILNSDCG